MHLDLPSFMVMQSFAVFCAGAMLVVASLQRRAAGVLVLWGAAHIIAAFAILVLVLGNVSGAPIWFLIGLTLFPLRSSLVWKAARNLDEKEAPWCLALLGPMAAFVVGSTLEGTLCSWQGLGAQCGNFLRPCPLADWIGRSAGIFIALFLRLRRMAKCHQPTKKYPRSRGTKLRRLATCGRSFQLCRPERGTMVGSFD
jgi:hypothetical protein